VSRHGQPLVEANLKVFPTSTLSGALNDIIIGGNAERINILPNGTWRSVD